MLKTHILSLLCSYQEKGPIVSVLRQSCAIRERRSRIGDTEWDTAIRELTADGLIAAGEKDLLTGDPTLSITDAGRAAVA